MQITVTGDLFGHNLMYLRKKHSLSRLALSRLLGTAAVLIEQWETCRVHPTLSMERLERICTIFQTDLHMLLHADLTAPSKIDAPGKNDPQRNMEIQP